MGGDPAGMMLRIFPPAQWWLPGINLTDNALATGVVPAGPGDSGREVDLGKWTDPARGSAAQLEGKPVSRPRSCRHGPRAL